MAMKSSPYVWVFFFAVELWFFALNHNNIILLRGVEAVTDPVDVEAMMHIKSSVDPATIFASSCLDSWDFTLDPCENKLKGSFVCGFDCAAGTSSAEGFQRVTNLELDSAGYGGALSPWIGNLSALQFCKISGNAMGGALPSSIGKLSQLVLMDLSFNTFGGYVPDSIGMLSNLQTLNLAGNGFQGQVPQSISRLIFVTELRLERNKFNGPLPDLSNLTQLQFLDASGNEFRGSLAPLNLPLSLCSVCLRNNLLTGKVPKTIVDLQQLNVLDLSGNQLSGSVDDTLLAHPSLQQLNLSTNKFNQLRVHPKHIAASQLVALDLSYNVMSGPLPAFFARMKRLSSLSLRYNFFHGVIPQSYALRATSAAIGGGAQPLERLLLDGNYLTGPLPAPFMNMVSEHSSLTASFVDNCLQKCPAQYGFCRGGKQKEETVCRLFNPSR